MTRIDTNIIIAGSMFAGFKNYATATFTASYGGGNLAAGAYSGPIRASTALNNNNSVGIVQVQYTGLDSFWRLIPGNIVTDYPTAGTRQYEIQSLTYFIAGVLYVDSYIINQTAGIVAVPAITFTCQADLYVAPF